MEVTGWKPDKTTKFLRDLHHGLPLCTPPRFNVTQRNCISFRRSRDRQGTSWQRSKPPSTKERGTQHSFGGINSDRSQQLKQVAPLDETEMVSDHDADDLEAYLKEATPLPRPKVWQPNYHMLPACDQHGVRIEADKWAAR